MEKIPVFAGYIRTSVKDENPEGSPKSQEIRILDYLNAIFGSSNFIYKTYIDSGFTGRNIQRDGYKRMIEDIKNNNIQGIVAVELSRFGRNVVELNILLELCKKKNVAFITLAERIDTSASYGLIVFSVFAALAEIESQRISERVTFNARRRIESGLWVSTPPYGYIVGEKVKGRLEIEESEANTVRLIFAKYLEFGCYSRVSDWLNTNGYRHNGGKWYNSSIERILKNIAYTGKREYRDKMIKGLWPPIISQQQFDEVQSKKKGRAKIHTRMSNSKYLLSGLLYCTACNEYLISAAGTSKTGETYLYYGHKKHSPACSCPNYIPAEKIERLILERITRIATNDEIIKLTFEEVFKRYKSIESEYQQSERNIQKILDKIEAQASQLIDTIQRLTQEQVNLFVQPKLDVLLSEKKKTLRELDEVKRILEKLKEHQPTVEKLKENLGKIDIYLLFANRETQKKAVRLLIEKVELQANEILVYMFDPMKKEVFKHLPSCGQHRKQFEHLFLGNNTNYFIVRIPFL